MTEAEWLACEDPIAMVRFLRSKGSDRKWRLVMCQLAPLDHTIRRGDVDAWRKSIELGEQWADGQISTAEVTAFCRATCTEPGLGVWVSLEPQAIESVEAVAESGRWYFTQCIPRLVRECFGNPFRPVTFPPEWRTDTAVALARQMYEAREFSAMPILADALQDAGCDNADVLNHCRDASLNHVRGCWVVDLVLDKERPGRESARLAGTGR
jgi:hypothetical protein